MSIFDGFDIAASSMSAQRTRMNVAATNLANKSTTRTPEGGPYKRRDVVLEAVDLGRDRFRELVDGQIERNVEPDLGVQVSEVAVSEDDPLKVYDPGHPDADGEGYVSYPNVNGVQETVNLIGAARAYEASAAVIQTIKQMAEQALRIGR